MMTGEINNFSGSSKSSGRDGGTREQFWQRRAAVAQ